MDQEPTLASIAVRLDRLEAFIQRFSPVIDPAPDDWGRPWPWPSGRIPFPPPPGGDPPPPDLTRLSRVQLELTLEAIRAQRIQLDAYEEHVKAQLAKGG